MNSLGSFAAVSAVGFAALAVVPMVGSDYVTSLMISLLMYANLATAWGIFCGTTRLVSLASTAFFGVGCYATAAFGEQLPWPLLLLVAGIAGGALAFLVGLCTLRLSGMYFVVFSFGVAELLRQVVTWSESKWMGSVGRYQAVEIPIVTLGWMSDDLAG